MSDAPFPAGILLGRAVAEYVTKTDGELSRVYEVRFTDGADPVIVKVYAAAWRWKQAKEVYVYRAAGPPWRRPLAEVSASLDDDDLREVCRQMGVLLAGVPAPKPDNTAYMTAQFTKKLREFTELGGDGALHDTIERYVAANAGLFAGCTAPVLCHNDFHEGNILIERNATPATGWRITGFIDVENAIAADRVMDLAKTGASGSHEHDIGLERMPACALYHALELWDWFASIAHTGPLGDLAADMRAIVDA